MEDKNHLVISVEKKKVFEKYNIFSWQESSTNWETKQQTST